MTLIVTLISTLIKGRDLGHWTKHVSEKMTELGKVFKELRKCEDRMRRFFKSAVAKAAEHPRPKRTAILEADIRNIPAHMYGDHSKCTHAKRKTASTPAFIDPNARAALQAECDKWALQAKYYRDAGDDENTNSNEGFHSPFHGICRKEEDIHENYGLFADSATGAKDQGPLAPHPHHFCLLTLTITPPLPLILSQIKALVIERRSIVGWGRLSQIMQWCGANVRRRTTSRYVYSSMIMTFSLIQF